jgi:hypothetical protein
MASSTVSVGTNVPVSGYAWVKGALVNVWLLPSPKLKVHFVNALMPEGVEWSLKVIAAFLQPPMDAALKFAVGPTTFTALATNMVSVQLLISVITNPTLCVPGVARLAI